MRKGQLADLARQEASGALKLLPWLLGCVVVMLILWQTGLAGASGLFQSPPAPTSPLPTATAPPPTATQSPTQIPQTTNTPAPTVETGTPTELPTSSVESTGLPTSTVTITPTVTATFTPTQTAEPTATPSPSATPDTDEASLEDEGDLAFDWAELFDALALGATYLWLCCGVLLFLGIPVFFAVLWVTYKRRHEGADQAEE
ncbi:MAG: hypothetical protein PVI09_22850 [Anaerolineae bacterium]|jgi:hypothetical protein